MQTIAPSAVKLKRRTPSMARAAASCARPFIFLWLRLDDGMGVCLPVSHRLLASRVFPRNPKSHPPPHGISNCGVARIHTEEGGKRKECERRKAVSQSGRRDNGWTRHRPRRWAVKTLLTPWVAETPNNALLGTCKKAWRGRDKGEGGPHVPRGHGPQALWPAGCRETLERQGRELGWRGERARPGKNRRSYDHNRILRELRTYQETKTP